MSSQRMCILTNIVWDAAQLSLLTGSAVPSQPISNTQLDNQSRSFITNDDSVQILATFHDLMVIQMLVAYGHNLSNTAQWQLQLYDTDDRTNLIYDSGLLDAIETKTIAEWNWQLEPVVSSAFGPNNPRYSSLTINEPLFAKCAVITIQDQGSTEIKIPRMLIGSPTSPEVNFAYGAKITVPTSTSIPTDAGMLAVNKQNKRKISFELQHINELDQSKFIDLVQLPGSFYISLYPGIGGQREINHTMLAALNTDITLTHNYFDNSATTIEAIEI